MFNCASSPRLIPNCESGVDTVVSLRKKDRNGGISEWSVRCRQGNTEPFYFEGWD